MSSSVSSWNKCRVCLVAETEMNHLFQPYLDNQSLAEILQNLSHIQLECLVGLPQMICFTCTETVMSFKHLTKTLKDTEEYLNKLVNDPNLNPNIVTTLGVDQDKYVPFQNDDEPGDNNDNTDVSDTEEIKDCNVAVSVEAPTPSDNDSKKAIENEAAAVDSDYIEVTSLKYSCELCGDCYLFKTGFSHHMLIVHNLCVQVSQYEQYSSLVKFKIPKTTPDTPYKIIKKQQQSSKNVPCVGSLVCKRCKQKFASVAELKVHSEVHKTYKCEQCGAAFIRNSYLRDHLLKHSIEKCYSCKICGQKFKYRSALAVHRRDHFGNYRGHMCETCGKSFKEKGTLKTHIKLKHTNERDFSCSGCGLAFKLKAARDKHFVRKHTDNRTKDFVCFVCGMAYLNKETLTRHMNDKHSEAPLTHWCNVCEKTFTMRSNLLKHLRNKHNVITKHD